MEARESRIEKRGTEAVASNSNETRQEARIAQEEEESEPTVRESGGNAEETKAAMRSDRSGGNKRRAKKRKLVDDDDDEDADVRQSGSSNGDGVSTVSSDGLSSPEPVENQNLFRPGQAQRPNT